MASSPTTAQTSNIDDKLIRSLLVPESTAGQILFVQEGVALKGAASHDAQTYLGTVFVTSDVTGAIYILWLPYSFVYYTDPALVSPATKQSLALDKANLPATDGKPLLTSDGHIPLCAMRAEWLFSQCIPFESVNRIRCKVTIRGKRVITLHRSVLLLSSSSSASSSSSSGAALSNNNSSIENYPLTFHDGGVDRLLAVLGSFATVQSAPGGSHDDYTVQHQTRSVPAPVHSMNPSAVGATQHYQSPTQQQLQDPILQFRDQTYNSNGKDAAKKVGQRMLNNLVGLVARGGRFLAEAFLDDDDDRSLRPSIQTPFVSSSAKNREPLAPSSSPDGSGGDFDMMAPLQPIEEVKPQLRFPSSTLPPRGPPLTKSQWLDCFDSSNGGALDPSKFARARNIVFEGGVSEDDNIRGEVNHIRGDLWKYLLGVYPVDATAAARQAIDEENVALYETILRQWTSIGPEQEKHFTAFRERRTAVDKDVARTDRTHAAFAEDHSDKLVAMRRLLLTYSFYNFDIGYCQGMSDLIAVLLLLYPSEADVFAVFRRLMVKCGGNFMNGDQHTMAQQLRAVEVLTHAFVPPLYTHLQKQQATNMCFCFRWLLVLFKREFPVESVVRIWDVIFSCPFTDRYEVILTTALLRAASEQIIDHAMQFDELLKYSNLLCSGLTSVDELLRAASEFYGFCMQQYEWASSNKSNNNDNNNSNNHNSKSMTAASTNAVLADQERRTRRHVEGVDKQESRPSVRDLVEAFDIK